MLLSAPYLISIKWSQGKPLLTTAFIVRCVKKEVCEANGPVSITIIRRPLHMIFFLLLILWGKFSPRSPFFSEAAVHWKDLSDLIGSLQLILFVLSELHALEKGNFQEEERGTWREGGLLSEDLGLTITTGIQGGFWLVCFPIYSLQQGQKLQLCTMFFGGFFVTSLD